MSHPSLQHFISTVLVLLVTAGTLVGQEIPIDIVDRVNAVDYIFEGNVIKSTPYKTANEKYIYTSNTIHITKILKGDLTCGTVELITDGGIVDGLWVDPSHNLDLRKGCAGIFLAKGTAKELSAVDFYEESNYQKIEATFQNQSFIKYWHDGVDWRVSDVWANFDSLAQVYNLAELITGLNFVDCEAPTIIGGWNEVVTPSEPMQVTLRPDLDLIRQRMAEVAAKRLQIQLQAQGGGGLGEVTYGMTNLEVTGSDPLYLEFDININDDLGTKYLYWAGARVVYDTLVFGSNIGQTSNIDVSNIGLIADLNCYGYTYPNDLESNSYVAFAQPAFQSQCLAVVPTTPVPVFHIRMKILDCLASTITMVDSAFFDGPSAVLYYTAWSETTVAGDIFDYATANIDQTEEIEACGPMITSFSPTTVAGGIQQILEIHGTGFGATRGTGTVFFKNADDGGVSEVACDANDFLPVDGWSDELIRVYMPSADTSTRIIDSDTIVTPNCTAGSGVFRVVTNEGLSLTSAAPLVVSYSILSDARFAPKPPALLGPLVEYEGRFTYHIDSLVAAYEDGALIPIIKKAFREWTCHTGIDWNVADGPVYDNLPGPAADSICVIKFGALVANRLAQTNNYIGPCSTHVYSVQSDLTISNNPLYTWFIDTVPEHPVPTGQYDLYHILLHELGHAHNLQHVIDSEAMMYFAGNSDEGLRRIQLYADASSYEGGSWVMDESFSHPPPFPSCELSPISIITAPYCSGFYGVEDHFQRENVIALPNPCDKYLTITSFEKRIREVQVHNALGALLSRSLLLPTQLAEIDFSSFGSGLYLVKVLFSDNTSVCVKAIKEN